MDPYTLVIASHKGGTGNTSLTLGLAYLLGKSGQSVEVIDANKQKNIYLIAQDASGHCPWKNVSLGPSSESHFDWRIIDAPPLTHPDSQSCLAKADGLILSSLPDPLAVRTFHKAVEISSQACADNPKLELLGVVIQMFREESQVQKKIMALIDEEMGPILLTRPVPYDRSLSMWALNPGSPLPQGPAAERAQDIQRALQQIREDRQTQTSVHHAQSDPVMIPVTQEPSLPPQFQSNSSQESLGSPTLAAPVIPFGEASPRASVPQPAAPVVSKALIPFSEDTQPVKETPHRERPRVISPVKAERRPPSPLQRSSAPFATETLSAGASKQRIQCYVCRGSVNERDILQGRARVFGDLTACRSCAPQVGSMPAHMKAENGGRRSSQKSASTTRLLMRRFLSFLGASSSD